MFRIVAASSPRWSPRAWMSSSCSRETKGADPELVLALPQYSANALTTVLAPFSFGQPKKGVEKGPQALLDAGLMEAIRGIPTPSYNIKYPLIPRTRLWEDIETESCEERFWAKHGLEEPSQDKAGHVMRPRLTGGASESLNEVALDAAEKGRFVLTLGGDHSLAVGSIAAIQRVYQDVGVVWVDAHADINTARTTPSGNLHGCPMSFLLGIDQGESLPGYEWLSSQERSFSFLRPNRLVYIGLRDVDDGERAILQELDIACYSMSDIERHGFSETVARAIHAIDSTGSIPIHCSFDIDALDPFYAPSTGTPVSCGMSLLQGKYLCESLARSGRLVSFDLMEFNPALGSSQQVATTLQSAKQIILSALGATYLS